MVEVMVGHLVAIKFCCDLLKMSVTDPIEIHCGSFQGFLRGFLTYQLCCIISQGSRSTSNFKPKFRSWLVVGGIARCQIALNFLSLSRAINGRGASSKRSVPYETHCQYTHACSTEERPLGRPGAARDGGDRSV